YQSLKGKDTYRDDWTGDIAISVNQSYLDNDGIPGKGVHSVNVRENTFDDNWGCEQIDWRFTKSNGEQKQFCSILDSFITKNLELKAEKHTTTKSFTLKGERDAGWKDVNRIYVAPVYENGNLGSFTPVNYRDQGKDNYSIRYHVDGELYNAGKVRGLVLSIPHDSTFCASGYYVKYYEYTLKDNSGREYTVCKNTNQLLRPNMTVYLWPN
ncbi:MAG: hypothetical protein HUJ63_13800, partial [Enterococcus sp.]|nr:hypothetical protein [Enterococcus sp.]